MAKASKKKSAKKTNLKTSVRTSLKKTVTMSAGKTTSKKAAGRKRGPKKGSKRIVYPVALRKQVAQAVRKGMKRLEAAKKFKVGVHSIPGWLKKH